MPRLKLNCTPDLGFEPRYCHMPVQGTLLDDAAQLVRPGGMLVYSSCSIELEENEEQVARFLQKWPSFSLHMPDHMPAGTLS